MDYQELLARLRRGNYYHAQIEEAADVIESLLAENKQLKSESDEWEADSNQWEQEYYKKDAELAKYRDAKMGGDFDSEQVGYWCVVCGRFLRADEFGVIVHDDKSHPESTTFEEPMQ